MTATHKKVTSTDQRIHVMPHFTVRLQISDDLFFNNFQSIEVRCGGNTVRN